MSKNLIAVSTWPWGATTKEQIEKSFQDISAIGYTAFETVRDACRTYDYDCTEYRKLCERYGVKPVSFYFLLPQPEERNLLFDNLERDLDFVKAMGVNSVCLQGTVGRPEAGDERRAEQEFEMIRDFAEQTKKYGVMTNVHPHHGTWIMYENEFEKIFKMLDADTVSLCPDTAHLAVAGCDVTGVIKKYIDRIGFTHFKDISFWGVTKETLHTCGTEIYDNFRELGRGDINFAEIFDLLKKSGYKNALCSEFDCAAVSNYESAKVNFEYLKKNYPAK